MDPRRTRKSQQDLVTTAHVYKENKRILLDSSSPILIRMRIMIRKPRKPCFTHIDLKRSMCKIPSTSHHEISKAVAIGP